MHTETLLRGNWTVLALVVNGHCLANEFREGITEEADRKKVLALLEHVRDYGPPRNTDKSNDLGGGLFELKPSNQIRFSLLLPWPQDNRDYARFAQEEAKDASSGNQACA